jgi:hypothetical protein
VVSKNGNTTYQKLRDAEQAVFKREFYSNNAYINKEGRFQVNIPTPPPKKKLEKEQIKPKIRRMEIMSIRAKINEKESGKMIEKKSIKL